MPKARKTSAKKRRRQNKQYHLSKKNQLSEPINLPDTLKCNDGSVYDHTVTACDATESIDLPDVPEQNDSSVYNHNLTLCDTTQLTLACNSDKEKLGKKNQLSEPINLPGAPECNDGSMDLPDTLEQNDSSVYDHNLTLCDTTQLTLACNFEDEITVRDRQLLDKRERSMVSYYNNHEKKLEKVKKYHKNHRQARLNNFKKHHAANREKRLESFKDNHAANREKRLQSFKNYYAANRDQELERFKDYYASHNQQIKDNAREHYAAVANTKNTKLRQKYRIHITKSHTKSVAPKNRAKFIEEMNKKRQRNTVCYKKNATRLKQNRRARYALKLTEPKLEAKQKYISLIRGKLAKNVGVQKQLKVAFSFDKSLPIAVTQSGINLIASRRLVNLILNIRKHFAGLLLRVIKRVNNNPYIGNGDFGEHNETANDNDADNDINLNNENDNIKDSSNVNIDTDEDIPEKDGDVHVDSDSGCPNEHDPKKNGHPLACFEDDSECKSKLRILRAASPHYPMLRTFLRNIYQAMNCDDAVSPIDQALIEGDVDALIKIATESDPSNEKNDVAQIFSSRYEGDSDINLRDPDLEAKLLKENVNLIAEFQKEISDQNEHVCCSCRRLMRRSNLTNVFDKDKESEAWRELEAFLTDYDPDFDSKQLLMCRHCKPIIRNNRIPARCVLNGLQSEPLPDELKGLDPFSTQLIQLAKCFQTVVRLGTYTAKVPIYNSLKACKGTVFYLPLSLEKTTKTLGEAKDFRPKNFPDPELY
uniref:USP domain-containing protein n=1 Tax=Amphimedon queenslandica TaxID=400682 RepID=A0A1X7TPG9_AMPQE